MASSQEIINNIKQVRTAAYGKDVREAIARGLEICYGYTSGEAADIAAERANRAAAAVEAVIDRATRATDDVSQALANIDDIVKVSTTQPTERENKIWIQPQDETEYKIATFGAYEELWSRMNDIRNVYEQGHGGIISIIRDDTYMDPSDLLKKRYAVSYSDGTTSEFFVNDGPTGDVGPVDMIVETNVYYKKVTPQEFTPIPPTTYADNLPELDPGDYLWTITEITYGSGAQAYLYGLSKWGLDGAPGRDGVNGSGAVNSVAIGQDGPPLVGAVKLPVDASPASGSNSLITSGAVFTALGTRAALASPAFTGTPTAPTPAAGNNTQQIATTAFVNTSISALKHFRASVTLTSTSLTYKDNRIDANTYCYISGFDPAKLKGTLSWTTAAGSLTLTASVAPSSSMGLALVFVNTTT